MPLLPAFGEAQSTQYQRAERELDDNDERDIENAKLKYVVGEQGKIDICFSIDELISFVFFFSSHSSAKARRRYRRATFA